MPPFNPFSVAITAIICGACIAIFAPLVRAYAKRMERGSDSSLSSDDVEARLARIEHAVEAIAVEVERVSEGQRFTTKLLAEQRGHVSDGSVSR